MHTSSLELARRPGNRRWLTAAALGLSLVLGPLAVGGSATTESTAERRPEVVRPDRERPARDLEVLNLECRVAEVDEKDDRADTRVHIGCRWRAAQSERAAGYQLWRVVDRAHRELVARGGLDLLGARDAISAEATVVRYAVLAVDENGRRVGQSRVEWIVLGDDPNVDPERARKARIGRIQ